MIGHLDVYSNGNLHGWFSGPAGQPLVVEIDGRFAGVARTGLARPDVNAEGLAEGDVGFSFRVPAAFIDGRRHAVEMRAVTGPTGRRLRKALAFEGDVPATAPGASAGRGRAAVVCWDLAHNPAGRAWVLVDLLRERHARVDLVGPLFPRFGRSLWPPLEGLDDLSVISEPVERFADLERLGDRLAAEGYDFVHVCKPRWPSLYLGQRIASACGCGVALDIDDHELSFFPAGTETLGADPQAVRRRIERDEIHPCDGEATAAAERLIRHYPMRTVSNPALAERFGGHLVRHTRRASVFDPARQSRAASRAAFGYGEGERVVLFAGTLRRHKGVLEIARAIAALKDPSVHLCLVGTIEEAALEREVRAALGSRVAIHPGVPVAGLPAVVQMADLVCLAQDRGHATSAFQVPAKLTDALAMGVPALLEDLPPFADLAGLPGIVFRGERPLSEAIAEALADRHAPRAVRDAFLAEFSAEAAAPALARALDRAPATEAEDRAALDAALLGVARREDAPAPVPRPAAGPHLLKGRGRDVVFLWKQNDSGLFGRRSDMIAKYLPIVGGAGRVIHFDASISLATLERLAEGEADPMRMDGLVHANVMRRWMGLADDLFTRRFTFVTDTHGRSLMGRALPKPEDLPELYRRTLRDLGASDEALLWVCPAAFDLEPVMRARAFVHVAADLIDDQRAFDTDPRHLDRLERAYRRTIVRADTVFANCAGVAESFGAMLRYKDVFVVSNAAERLSAESLAAVDLFPGERVTRIGYVGNMRDRFDAGLVERLASADPSWRVVLVGPTGGNPEVEALGRLRNVTLTGPLRYEDANRLAAGFDIAILPHVDNALTQTMNPLKIYLYRTLGLPVVATGVGNLDNLDPGVTVARDAEAFVEAVARIAARGARRVPRADQGPTWEAHVAGIADILSRRIEGEQDAAETAPPGWQVAAP